MKGQSYKAISSNTVYARISTQKNQLSCTLLVSLHKFKIVIKMVLVKRILLVIIQIKTSTNEANIP